MNQFLLIEILLSSSIKHSTRLPHRQSFHILSLQISIKFVWGYWLSFTIGRTFTFSVLRACWGRYTLAHEYCYSILINLSIVCYLCYKDIAFRILVYFIHFETNRIKFLSIGIRKVVDNRHTFTYIFASLSTILILAKFLSHILPNGTIFQ